MTQSILARPARATAALVAVAGLALAGVTATGTPPADASAPAHAPAATDWSARAIDSYDALQDNLYLGSAGHDLYKESLDTSAGTNPYSFLWEFREASTAAIDLQGIPGVGKAYQNSAADRVAGLQNYYAVAAGNRPGYESYLPAPLGGGGDVYYDDNSVVGLSFFSEFQATKDPAYLTKAEAAFGIVSRGWNTDGSLACPGGMNWIDTPSNTVRAANVTGLAAQLAAHLYEQTHQAAYLGWSQKLFDWNNACLKQSAGLYENSRSTDGTVDPTLWTYNSGAMIATAAILYRATGESTYLRQANQAAAGSLAYWTVGDRLQQQPAIFNSFYFQDLLLLDSISPNPHYRAVIENYADATWQNNRDTTTGLFHFQPSGGGDYDAARPAATLDQAAMIQIFAALAWDPRHLSTIS